MESTHGLGLGHSLGHGLPCGLMYGLLYGLLVVRFLKHKDSIGKSKMSTQA